LKYYFVILQDICGNRNGPDWPRGEGYGAVMSLPHVDGNDDVEYRFRVGRVSETFRRFLPDKDLVAVETEAHKAGKVTPKVSPIGWATMRLSGQVVPADSQVPTNKKRKDGVFLGKLISVSWVESTHLVVVPLVV